MRSRILCFFGKYSYGIYVFNRLLVVPVRLLIRPDLLANHLGVDCAVVLQIVVGVAINVGLALFSWYLFERHFLRLKRHFT